MSSYSNILIIKLSALGDVIQALGHMRAVRQHFDKAKITLITTKPYKDLLTASGYADHVICDTKPKFWQIGQWVDLRQKLTAPDYDLVIDFQNNDRTKIYKALMGKKPDWAATHQGSKYHNSSHTKQNSHAVERHKETLKLLGITKLGHDDLSWIKPDTEFDIPGSAYALIVPGAAPSRPQKKWPHQSYTELCGFLLNKGIQPVLIGTKFEENIGRFILCKFPNVTNLIEKTSLMDLPHLGRNAKIIIGNDTGPMHIFGATNSPCLTLFSRFSDPLKHRPRGASTHYLQTNDLESLSVESVQSKIGEIVNLS